MEIVSGRMGISVGVAEVGSTVGGVRVRVGGIDGGAVTWTVAVAAGKVCTEKLHPCIHSEINTRRRTERNHFHRFIELSLSAMRYTGNF
jgi:hypothetical protein